MTLAACLLGSWGSALIGILLGMVVGALWQRSHMRSRPPLPPPMKLEPGARFLRPGALISAAPASVVTIRGRTPKPGRTPKRKKRPGAEK